MTLNNAAVVKLECCRVEYSNFALIIKDPIVMNQLYMIHQTHACEFQLHINRGKIQSIKKSVTRQRNSVTRQIGAVAPLSLRQL